MSYHRRDALDYHGPGRRAEIAVVPTRPASTQRVLSLACSPGVAISAPACFYTEEELERLLDIRVFHDDQHGIPPGMARPVHVLRRGSEAVEVAGLTALAVVDARWRRNAPQAG